MAALFISISGIQRVFITGGIAKTCSMQKSVLFANGVETINFCLGW
jgi:hypothetical protein